VDGTDGDDRDWSELNTLKQVRMEFQRRGRRAEQLEITDRGVRALLVDMEERDVNTQLN